MLGSVIGRSVIKHKVIKRASSVFLAPSSVDLLFGSLLSYTSLRSSFRLFVIRLFGYGISEWCKWWCDVDTAKNLIFYCVMSNILFINYRKQVHYFSGECGSKNFSYRSESFLNSPICTLPASVNYSDNGYYKGQWSCLLMALPGCKIRS